MLLIDILSGKKSKSVPFWFMRQAGRYLPEYKKIRAGFPDFLSFCYTPDAACEVTLQPITRFNMSAAIIFSDILVIPDALGVKVAFKESVGPVLEPVQNESSLSALSTDGMEEKLAPVYEAIRLTRAALPMDKALIGFCGSPWTLACYVLQGKSSRDFSQSREIAFENKIFFQKIMQLLESSVIRHACNQIEAGANAIQLFDSWSGVLSEKEFVDYVIGPTRRIVSEIRRKHPHIPIIGFPRMCGEKITAYAMETKVNAVSFDGSIRLDYAQNIMQYNIAVQGNLDSMLLAHDKQAALKQTQELLNRFAGTSYVFNLAHGILPHTPIENVQAVTDMIQAHL